MKQLLALLCGVLVSGCITLQPRAHTPSDATFVIPDVPLRAWKDNQCGSGALAAVLNRFGDPVSEQQLDATLDKGLRGGVVSVDMLLEARRRGFDAELVPGSVAIVRDSVLSGSPVILMLRSVNLPLRGRDAYHYVVIDGFDAERELFRLQWGKGSARWVRISSLDRSWRATQNATLLVRGRSASALRDDELLKRAVALQESGKAEAAIALYRDLIARDVSSPLLWTNLGNAQRDAQRAEDAETSYRRAIELDPQHRDALNNLAWTLYESRRLDEAAAFARQAASIDGPDSQYVFDTLGDIEAARGDCVAATAALRRAAEATPADARAEALLKLAAQQVRCRDGTVERTLELALAAGADRDAVSAIRERRP